MDVLLIVGGAYAGKRKSALKRLAHQEAAWVSAYRNDLPGDWAGRWQSSAVLVMEGWEQWLDGESWTERDGENLIAELKREEVNRRRQWGTERHLVILLMLETGRGVVPMEASSRRLRDAAGRLLQEAARTSDEVVYVWNGLERPLKPREDIH